MFGSVSFETVWKALYGDKVVSTSILSFIRFLEKRLKAHVVFDAADIPFGMPELLDLFERAEVLKRANIIKSYHMGSRLPDEPRFFQWRAAVGLGESSTSGGMSIESHRAALTATLAEALERYLWYAETDYFISPRTATAAQIARAGAALLPSRFAGFSSAQRAKDKRLTLSDDAQYMWIKGRSLINDSRIWVPAQAVSGKYGSANLKNENGEPLIILPITTGLATGPTRQFALRNGALEIIERDAFMITWLNHLTLPRIDLQKVREKSETLAKLLDSCARYRLRVDAMRMPTDAPAYAVCVVVRDDSAAGPPFALGLKAHQRLSHAIEGALLEALRMRQTARMHPTPLTKDKRELVHMERIPYWNNRERAPLLNFLTKGPLTAVTEGETWDNDDIGAHLARIVRWCADAGYGCASVSLGTSAKNVTPWHVEMVLIPELIPVHLREHYPYTAAARIRDIPKRFGYEPRNEPYLDEPHPFS